MLHTGYPWRTLSAVSRAVEESNRRMLRARDAMDRAYAQPLDVAALARIAHVSEAHFIRTFRATFDETPHRYLQRRRVERAMLLLRETDSSVTEICLDSASAASARSAARSARSSARRRAPTAGAQTSGRRRRASRWRGRDRAVSEKPAPRTATSLGSPPSHSQIYVLDQDQALDFYVGKLGLDVETDADLGFMRWLTVNVPGDPGREIVLQLRGPPSLDDATAEQVRELVTKGAMGGWIIFGTQDCRRTYEELLAKGVEFTQEPVEHFYGIDCALRDPFGNPIRITQRAPKPYDIPAPGAKLGAPAD